MTDTALRATRLSTGAAVIVSFALGTADPREPLEAGTRALFEASRDAQLLLDPTFRVEVANPAAARLFGSRGGDLRGRTFDTLFAASAQTAFAGLYAALRTSDRAPVPLRLEVEGPDQRPIPVEVDVVRLALPGNFRYGATVRDLRAPGPSAVPAAGARPYSLPELLLADRLKELV